ncbi:MAG TPA: DUF1820 family protein [bacterium]|nr:DUF1820 family protein [bacterium]
MAKKVEYAYCIYYAKHENEEYELHARSVRTAELLGFIEVQDFVFPKPSSLIIKPDGEKVEREFKGVVSTCIPIKDIRRIDRYPLTDAVTTSHLKVIEMRPKAGK